jgi:hypothetical protein
MLVSYIIIAMIIKVTDKIPMKFIYNNFIGANLYELIKLQLISMDTLWVISYLNMIHIIVVEVFKDLLARAEG